MFQFENKILVKNRKLPLYISVPIIVVISFFDLNAFANNFPPRVEGNDSSIDFSQSMIVGRKKSVDFQKPISLNPLQFKNRAACADASQYPTNTIFILLDSTNVGKAAYQLSKETGSDTNSRINEAIIEYKNTLLLLIRNIHERLSSGSLPLLPSSSNEKSLKNNAEYWKVVQSCQGNEWNCSNMDNYIEKIWGNNNKNNPSVLGNLSCHYIKKFSPLQSHLVKPRPDDDSIFKLNKTLKEKGKYISSCDNPSSEKNGTYQLDILNTNTDSWEKNGFDYWNSLKIYLSWAWRNSDESKKNKYSYLLRSINLEESIIFVPNGCASINVPSCSSNHIYLNSMRRLADPNQKIQKLYDDYFTSLPEELEKSLLKNPLPAVNNNSLRIYYEDNIDQSPSASKWTSDLFSKVSKAGIYTKRKLASALKVLSFIKSQLTKEKLLINFNNDAWVKDSSKDNRLYFMCSEYTFTNNNFINGMKSKIDSMEKIGQLNNLSGFIPASTIRESLSYYQEIRDEVVRFCEKRDLRFNRNKGTKRGHSQWFLDELKKVGMIENENIISKRNYGRDSLREPFAVLPGYSKNKNSKNILCGTLLDCTLLLQDSIMNTYSSMNNMEPLLALSGEIRSPAMFNPYSERVACELYDPWAATNERIFNIIASIFRGALFAVNPWLAILNVRLDPGEVISLERLIEDGKIKFKTNKEKQTIKVGLIANLGPLFNIPCTISIDEKLKYATIMPPVSIGITTQYCGSSQNIDHIIGNDGKLSKKSSNFAGCGACYISLSSLPIIQDYFNPLFFIESLLSYSYRKENDPYNIPDSRTIDLDNLQLVSSEFGDDESIPKICLNQIKNGRKCWPYPYPKCMKNIYYQTQKYLKNSNFISNIDMKEFAKFGYAKVKLNESKNSIKIYATLDYQGASSLGKQKSDGNCTIRKSRLPKEYFR